MPNSRKKISFSIINDYGGFKEQTHLVLEKTRGANYECLEIRMRDDTTGEENEITLSYSDLSALKQFLQKL